jgi:hypothetical protein
MSENYEKELIATIYFYNSEVPQIEVYATKETVPKIYAGTCNGIPFLHVVQISKSDGHVVREFRLAGTFTILIGANQKLYPEECDQKEEDKK